MRVRMRKYVTYIVRAQIVYILFACERVCVRGLVNYAGVECVLAVAFILGSFLGVLRYK